jgi:hypothetical protein
LFVFSVVGLELRAYTLSHSTSPFGEMDFFKIGFYKLFPQAGFKPDPPDLCLLSS